MLAKIISYAPTRIEAIDILANGLDEYVIEGVQHNARLVNAVLRHPSFRAGDTPTSFLPRHIPKFTGVQLTDGQEEDLAVAVALISRTRESYLEQPPISPKSAPVVVRLGGMFGKAFSVTVDDGSTATVQRLATTDAASGESVSEGAGRAVAVDRLQYDPDHCLARISLDGDDRAVQVRPSVSHVCTYMCILHVFEFRTNIPCE
jgi:acetyl/propionyl-CoA carboxylase alpha subunit